MLQTYIIFILFFGVVARGIWDVWSQAFVHSLTALFFLYLSVRQRIKFPADTPSKVFLIFIVFLLFNTFISKNRFDSFNEFLNHANYFLFFLLAAKLSRGEAVKIKTGVFYIGVFLALLFLMQKVFQPHNALWATLPKQNILSSVLIISLLLSIEYFRLNGRNLVGIFIIALALFFCLTVSTSIGLISGIFYILFAKHKKIRLHLVILTFTILAFFGFIKISEPNVTDRFFWWLSAIDIFRDYPFFGVGLGNFERYVQQYNYSGFHSTYAHSYYLNLLSEVGILGVGLFIILLYIILKRIDNFYVFGATLSIIITGIMDYPLNIPIISFFLFCISGLEMQKKEMSNSSSRFKVGFRVMIFAAAFLFLLGGFIKFDTSRKIEMAKRYYGEKEFLKSIDELDKIYFVSLCKLQVYELKFKNLIELKKAEESLICAKNLVNLEKMNAKNWYYLAVAASINKDYDLKKKALTNAARIAPYNNFYRQMMRAL